MKLNRTLGLLLVAGAAVGAGAGMAAATQTTAAPAASSATAPKPGARHWHHRPGGMLVGVMLRATRQLNLTSDQQASIKTILTNARARRQAEPHPAVDFTVLANPGDPNYAAALQNARAAAEARFQNQVEIQGQIYNVLRPDQKTRLPQVLAEMKSKAPQREHWMQQHGSEPIEPESN